MFDYESFGKRAAEAMERTLRKWVSEHNDIYIVSLDLSRDMDFLGIYGNTWYNLSEQTDADEEDYWYYKYCEAEWQLCDINETAEVSAAMSGYVEENDSQFTDPETFEYTEAFDEHCDRMIESCEKVLKRVRDAINADLPDLLLTFNISEFLDAEERAEIFASVNSAEAAAEYAAHITDFN